MASNLTTVDNSPDKAVSAPKPKFWKSPYVRFGGSALVLFLLLRRLHFHEVFGTIQRIPPGAFVVLFIAYMALHLLGVVKWRLLINLAGANLTFPQAVRCYYWGLFGNSFLPSLVGGDLVRGGMAFTFSRNKSAIVLGSLMDRVQDVGGLLVVTAGGILLLPGMLDYKAHKMFWTLAGVMAIGGVVGIGLLLVIPFRIFPFKLRRIFVKLRRGVRSMYRSPGTMFFCFLVGMVLQISQVAINYTLGEITGFHLAFAIWLFAWPLAKLSALVPLTQGGMGVREGVLAGLLSSFGAPAATALAAGLCFQFGVVWPGNLVGGALAFLMGRFSFARTKTL